ncbi:MAG: efflux RND transporter periplasmic adaptor subunit [Bacteroidota bacterium]|jgi:cobalt-zinc-cadmium efflux system membrane fusion protein
MKQLLVIFFLGCILLSCEQSTSEEHVHAPDGSHPGEEGLKSVSYTVYSEKSELFVEFKPLVVGSTSNFATHLTQLGEQFIPYTEGEVTVSLIIGTSGLKNSTMAPSSPGIFRLALQPQKAGWAKLVFNIKTQTFTDQMVIDSIQVFNDEKTAISAQSETSNNSDISYLKEQAWKVAFANAPIVKQTIFDVIKTTGEIMSAPGDAMTIVAKSNGIVKFSGNSLLLGVSVKKGQSLFSISGGEIPFENVDATKQLADAELLTAQKEFDRVAELIKDRLVTQSEFQTVKLRLENAKISLSNLKRNYYSGGKRADSPMDGTIKNVLVTEGQYVTAGQPLAVVSKNQKLVLKAELSLKYTDRISSITDANFRLIQNNKTFNTKELNGHLLSIGKTTEVNIPYLPIYFQIDGKPEIIPGSFAEVFLNTTAINNALVIPTSALIEEQGVFFAYVQTSGESFQKRELKLGVNNGFLVQVIGGLSEGERLVTKGAYQIKLSQASGTMPAHGHEH